jgi:hypothetical protein
MYIHFSISSMPKGTSPLAFFVAFPLAIVEEGECVNEYDTETNAETNTNTHNRAHAETQDPCGPNFLKLFFQITHDIVVIIISH